MNEGTFYCLRLDEDGTCLCINNVMTIDPVTDKVGFSPFLSTEGRDLWVTQAREDADAVCHATVDTVHYLGSSRALPRNPYAGKCHVTTVTIGDEATKSQAESNLDAVVHIYGIRDNTKGKLLGYTFYRSSLDGSTTNCTLGDYGNVWTTHSRQMAEEVINFHDGTYNAGYDLPFNPYIDCSVIRLC